MILLHLRDHGRGSEAFTWLSTPCIMATQQPASPTINAWLNGHFRKIALRGSHLRVLLGLNLWTKLASFSQTHNVEQPTTHHLDERFAEPKGTPLVLVYLS
ncbi:hypothetical protein TGAM01_v210569 [Trichoderma gamsii]|uniref:Uncharacterized protein n=1 Tax=Trichoderma gamsii TaxID=398673 RepID=A0A2P4Z8C0_9HYPO|nr:hypothetical protein TGAM01_v210569 [Trichoderma gamsii]PON20535.1 hypothetical protein TGAM01_v210569 [Trichoderma gamsii]